ncbi:hypothetical protein [Paraburkholderia terrae]|uniref:hypothetical protein n=1 Tax=Paraburkholderia terrae TaxID=311230 RepID=UPI001EE188BA|nr:hypothetical protein [Paraburkholderia terrae]GJH04494.1 hypothetical protein CBA19C8_28075 [Paraburkholderia terrae]
MDELGKVVGVLTAATLCLSVLFDWGYLEALGLSFGDVPTTIADHVRDALLWVPAMLTAALVYTTTELMSRRIERGLSEEELTKKSDSGKIASLLRRSPYKLYVVIAIAINILNYLVGDTFAKGMSLAGPLIMYEIVRWSFSHKQVSESIPRSLRTGITIMVPLCSFMYFFGYAKGIEALYAKPSVSLVSSESTSPAQVTLLRQMDKGILIKDATGKAVFYRWDTVKSVSKPLTTATERNRICRWFNILCNVAP